MSSAQEDSSSCCFQEERPNKRQKQPQNNNDETLPELCMERQWEKAAQRAQTHPTEATWSDHNATQHNNTKISSTPLALACRLGAPFETIQAIIEASPVQLRKLIPSYGTPLHEAIVCPFVDSKIISLLLETDEALGGPKQARAATLQDVDGHTPLHLLIRRRFQSLLGEDENDDWMAMLQALVSSCPNAVEIPDCGEYKEPPLVMALKANLYSHVGLQPHGGQDDLHVAMERRIFAMVSIMLKHSPQASCKILEGARGQYTALHSAVFHGRCSQTIQLLLQAEQQLRQDASTFTSKTSLLANTQGELPLHFCAMRGEPPQTIALLSEAAPQAVLSRDATHLTPMHWLWIRFVSTLLSLQEEETEQDETTIPTIVSNENQSRYTSWCRLQQEDDYYAHLKLIRQLDPPVDFLRMRHIPTELIHGSNDDGSYCNSANMTWAQTTSRVLKSIQTRYIQTQQQQLQQQDSNSNNVVEEQVQANNEGEANHEQQEHDAISWTRQEAVSALFWTKVVSLLQAASRATIASNSAQQQQDAPFLLTHAAMSTHACPPPLVWIATSLFPQELLMADLHGKLPLHYAACRLGENWKNGGNHCVYWGPDHAGGNHGGEEQHHFLVRGGGGNPELGGGGSNATFSCLPTDSLVVMEHAMSASPPKAAHVADFNGRLVLHHAIDALVKAVCSTNKNGYYYWHSSKSTASSAASSSSSLNNNSASPTTSTDPSCPATIMLDILMGLVKMYPESLERRDGKTKLYPFLQATATATEHKSATTSPNGYPLGGCPSRLSDEIPLSITYLLLRQNPSLVKDHNVD